MEVEVNGGRGLGGRRDGRSVGRSRQSLSQSIAQYLRHGSTNLLLGRDSFASARQWLIFRIDRILRMSGGRRLR